MAKVLYAKTHSNVFVPGAADLGTTIPPVGKTLVDLQMETNANDSLQVTFKYNSKTFTLLIPSAMIQVMSIAPEVKAPIKSSK